MNEIRKNKIVSEIKKSYNYFTNSVLKRTIPDVRDGLKPVQRRIIFSMYNNGLFFESKFVKSIKVVGEVLGKYHPHGDKSVYDAAVKLAQDFNLYYPLIQPQGNFGSIDGDSAANSRYTEMKLSKIARLMVGDLDFEVVDTTENFDQTELEPVVLPCKVPFALLNGNRGIGVGVVSNILPHNFNEIVDGCVFYLENPECTIEELISVIKGPDFPTGGEINGDNILDVYTKGTGNIEVRGSVEIDEENHQIIIVQIPYSIKKTQILKEIYILRKSKFMNEVLEVRDESDLNGIRVVIQCNKNFSLVNLKNKLFKKTSLQKKLYMNLLMYSNNKIKIFNLKDIIREFLEFRLSVFLKKHKHILTKLQFEFDNTELQLWCCNNSEAIISILKDSNSREEILLKLKKLGCEREEQQKKILSVPLYNLSKVETKKIQIKNEELHNKITDLNLLLSDRLKIKQCIIDELLSLKHVSFNRRSKIEYFDFKIDKNTLDDFEVLIYCFQNRFLFIENINLMQRKTIKNRSKIVSTQLGELNKIVLSSQNSRLYCFTTEGRVFRVMVNELPDIEMQDNIMNYFDIKKQFENNFVSFLSIKHNYDCESYIVCVTKKGKIAVRKAIKLYKSHNNVEFFKLQPGDTIVNTFNLLSLDHNICIITKLGKIIMFKAKDLRISKSSTFGSSGVKLVGNDCVTTADVVKSDKDVVYVFSHFGLGKGFNINKLGTTSKNCKGVKCMNLAKNDYIVGSIITDNVETDVFIQCKNSILYTNLNKITIYQSRNTKGVQIVKNDETINGILY